MSFEREFEIMREMEQKAVAFLHAKGVLMYDAETTAPPKSVEGRGRTLSVLGALEYEMMTDPELNSALETLSLHKDEFGEYEQREIKLSLKKVKEVSSIPKDEYIEYIVLVDEATDAWKRAKDAADYSIFEPYLDKIVIANRKMAHYYNPDMKPYDSLMDIYEEGLTMEFCDKFFAELKEGLLPIIDSVRNSEQVDNSFLFRPCPVEAQRRFSLKLCDMIPLDMEKLTLGEVEHPFTDNYNNSDVRLTTHYYEDNFPSNMYSILHEGGHSLYELNCDDRYNFTSMQGGVSMGIHESQSRFYENIIGHSKAYTACLLDAAREFFPEQLEGITYDQFYRALNKAELGPVRLEADELTYPLHIMVRYEIEKQLIDGSLDAKDAAKVWADLYEEYLGMRPKNDAEGILQDSHWAGGSIGYFPTYALGSAYGAQMLHMMEEEHPDLWEKIGAGDLSDVNGWLKEHIHRHACYYPPKELFENACGKFETRYFIDYLRDKFSDVYGF